MESVFLPELPGMWAIAFKAAAELKNGEIRVGKKMLFFSRGNDR